MPKMLFRFCEYKAFEKPIHRKYGKGLEKLTTMLSAYTLFAILNGYRLNLELNSNSMKIKKFHLH